MESSGGTASTSWQPIRQMIISNRKITLLQMDFKEIIPPHELARVSRAE
jgi:hypothetical protein